MSTFVLVHGAWHGGWCWRFVAARLRAKGHEVFTPTLTGLGERAHLLTPEVGLATMIRDVTSLIECEELNEVVLVGHSFAGLVITGVAERMANHLRHLVYLDAFVVKPGQSALSTLAPEIARERSRTVNDDGLRMLIPAPEKFGVTDAGQSAWMQRRLTPHPLKSYTDPLDYAEPIGNGVAKTYVAVTSPWYPPFSLIREEVKKDTGWNWREIASGHSAMVATPELLARMLEEIAG